MLIILSKKSFGIILFIVLILFITTILIFLNHTKATETYNNTTAYVALVIDDFGYNGEGIDNMLKLNIPLTAAVMPFQPFSESDYTTAYKSGLEIIMHTSMEPMHGKKEWLGPRAITCNLSNEDIKKNITDGLLQLPKAVGINNHMGSKVTKDIRIMKSILKITKENNMFFLDSKTTPHSVIPTLSKEMDVKYVVRDVFLDSSQDITYIENQLKILGDIALKKGYAIGIGHVGKEGGVVTAKAIEAMYPKLEEKGIKFVYLSDIVNYKYKNLNDLEN